MNKNNNKILHIILWICAIFCFTGFPWIFVSTEKLSNLFSVELTSISRLLFNLQSLFFAFFSLYFIMLARLYIYKTIIKIASVLIGVMGCYMYLLKYRTGLSNLSVDYEPFIWLFIGGVVYYLSRNLRDVMSQENKHYIKLRYLYLILSLMLAFNTISIIDSQWTWSLLCKIDYNSISEYDKYTFGLLSGFLSFSSIIIYYISNKISNFLCLARVSILFLLLFVSYSLMKIYESNMYTIFSVIFMSAFILLSISIILLQEYQVFNKK